MRDRMEMKAGPDASRTSSSARSADMVRTLPDTKVAALEETWATQGLGDPHGMVPKANGEPHSSLHDQTTVGRAKRQIDRRRSTP